MRLWTILSQRAVLWLQGAQALSFLHALMSQNVREEPSYGAFLTPQGRFGADAFVIPVIHHEQIVGAFLDCAQEHQSFIQTTIEKLAPFHDLTFKDLTQNYAVGVALGHAVQTLPLDFGPTLNVLDMRRKSSGLSHAQTISKGCQSPIPPTPNIFLGEGMCEPESPLNLGIAYTDPRQETLGFRALLPHHIAYSHLPNVCLTPASEAQYHYHRLSCQVPQGDQDCVVGRSMVVEYGFQDFHALAREKGCYVGQELMTRMMHQDMIRRSACVGRVIGGVIPPKGAILYGYLPQKNEDVSGPTSDAQGLGVEEDVPEVSQAFRAQDATWGAIGVMGGHASTDQGALALMVLDKSWQDLFGSSQEVQGCFWYGPKGEREPPEISAQVMARLHTFSFALF